MGRVASTSTEPAPAKPPQLISHKQPHLSRLCPVSLPQATMPFARQPSPPSAPTKSSTPTYPPISLEHTSSSSSSSSSGSDLYSSEASSSSSECERLASPLQQLSLSDEYRSLGPLRMRAPGAESFLPFASQERAESIRKTTHEEVMDKEHRHPEQRRMRRNIDLRQGREGEHSHSHTAVVALWGRGV